MVNSETVKITGVAVISTILGSLTMVTSGMMIHRRSTLSQSESVLFFTWVFTLMTIWAGFLQFVCGICLFFRRIVIKRWITVNAIAFLIIMCAVCVMSTVILRDRRDSKIVVVDHKTTTTTPKYIFNDDDVANETETLTIENFVEEENPATTNINSDTEEVTPNIEIKSSSKPTILDLYCGTLIANFIILPIFLGQMATRVKHEFKGRHLVERTYAYPLMSA